MSSVAQLANIGFEKLSKVASETVRGNSRLSDVVVKITIELAQQLALLKRDNNAPIPENILRFWKRISCEHNHLFENVLTIAEISPEQKNLFTSDLAR